MFTRVLVERYDKLDVVDGSPDLLARVADACRGRRATIRTHAALVKEFLSSHDRTWEHIYVTFLLEHVADPPDLLARPRCWLMK